MGRHPRMQEVYKTIGRIGGSDVTVLLRGESGTGKELVARAIHHSAGARAGPSSRSTARRSPTTLLETELFGHEKGAFTGARSGGWASSSWPTAARSSSTRSATCRSSCR